MTRFGISESTAKRDLRALIKGEQVAFVGPTKTGYYRLVPDCVSAENCPRIEQR